MAVAQEHLGSNISLEPADAEEFIFRLSTRAKAAVYAQRDKKLAEKREKKNHRRIGEGSHTRQGITVGG